jgi:GntR family transcriptional repressor for pyruvate dehydrogenase complex
MYKNCNELHDTSTILETLTSASKFETVRRTSTAEAIVQHLLTKIRRGEFGPGDRLPSERQLQIELGVGRLSLREALARLSALGVIRVDHGKGAFVQKNINGETIVNAFIPSFPDLNEKRLLDLVDARSLIEGELAAIVAEHRTNEDITRLNAILESGGQKIERYEELAELDYSFHREIARIADNQFLTVVVGALADHTRSFLLHFYIRTGREHSSVIKRHQPIIEAIVDRDPQRARECSRKHIDASKSNLKDYVKWAKAQGIRGIKGQ